jgi:lipoprotein-anchoring transpeptidase ErfK/SrfK
MNKKISLSKYFVTIPGLAISLLLSMLLTMTAFPVKSMASGFDPVYYAQKYPDVAAALGTSQKALISHYLTYGIPEGRFQNLQEEIDQKPLNTYIDIDLTTQHVVYILNGNVAFESDCVSGDVSKGRQTPTGTFAIYGHVPGQYLTGPTWKNWVDYWMPFSPGGCGLHDATWRKKFGGEIYKNNGSHGCVNLPHDKAKELFDMVSIGTVVIVH